MRFRWTDPDGSAEEIGISQPRFQAEKTALNIRRYIGEERAKE